jgi:hypothetical protein
MSVYCTVVCFSRVSMIYCTVYRVYTVYKVCVCVIIVYYLICSIKSLLLLADCCMVQYSMTEVQEEDDQSKATQSSDKAESASAVWSEKNAKKCNKRFFSQWPLHLIHTVYVLYCIALYCTVLCCILSFYSNFISFYLYYSR